MRRRKRGQRRIDPIVRSRALETLHLMRSRGLSLREAAQQSHTDPKTVRKYVPRALTRSPNGRFLPTPYDRYHRSLRFLTPHGLTAITVRDSRTASKIAAYWSAVDHYLKTGDTTRVYPFRGKTIQANKTTYHFLTDPTTLTRLGYAGEVRFEDLYTITT